MANNSLTFTSPASGVTFTLTAALAPDGEVHEQVFTTTTPAGDEIYLKVFATGDPDNPIQDYDTLVQGELYDIEAFSDVACTIPYDDSASPIVWTGTNVSFVGYTFSADRRPCHFAVYAGQQMQQGDATDVNAVGETWGVNKKNYRIAYPAGSDFTDTTKNGPLKWVQDQCFPLSAMGFERFSFSFISGYTSVSGNQPHYPSNPYSGLELTSTKVMLNKDTDIGHFVSQTPFTNTGKQGGTPGDMKACWTEAVKAMKQDVIDNGGSPELIAYTGYRPCYTDATMMAYDRTLLGYSKQADRGGWTGTGDAPAYSPSPGQSNALNTSGYSTYSEHHFNGWFGYEMAGLYKLGFDCIGLDTGSGMWWGGAGMTGAGANGDPTYGTSPGSSVLFDLFKSYGMGVQVEAVSWEDTGTTRRPWSGADGAIYEQGPAWGIAGTTVGWVGRCHDSPDVITWDGDSSPDDGTLWTNVYNREGDETATVGDPDHGGTAIPLTGPNGIDTEVHSVWRWNNSPVLTTLFANFSWLAIRQIMYDFKQAGFIISTSASVSADMTDKDGTVVTWEDFYQYVLALAKAPGESGAITTRPEPAPDGPYFDLDFTSMAVASGVIDDSTTTDFGVSGGRVFENYGVQATNAPTWGLQTSSSSNGWYQDTHVAKSINGNTSWQDSFVTDLGSPPVGDWVMEAKVARGAQTSLSATFGFLVRGGDRADRNYTVIGINPKAGVNNSVVKTFTSTTESNPQIESMVSGDLASDPEAHYFLRLTYDGVNYTLEGWVGDDDTGTKFCDQDVNGSLVPDHGNHFGWFAPSGLTNGRGISLFNFKMAPSGV